MLMATQVQLRWTGRQSGATGRRQVNDDGRVHGLVVDGAHRRVHVGGAPIRHDTISWSGSVHLSGRDPPSTRMPRAGTLQLGLLCGTTAKPAAETMCTACHMEGTCPQHRLPHCPSSSPPSSSPHAATSLSPWPSLPPHWSSLASSLLTAVPVSPSGNHPKGGKAGLAVAAWGLAGKACRVEGPGRTGWPSPRRPLSPGCTSSNPPPKHLRQACCIY